MGERRVAAGRRGEVTISARRHVVAMYSGGRWSGDALSGDGGRPMQAHRPAARDVRGRPLRRHRPRGPRAGRAAGGRLHDLPEWLDDRPAWRLIAVKHAGRPPRVRSTRTAATRRTDRAGCGGRGQQGDRWVRIDVRPPQPGTTGAPGGRGRIGRTSTAPRCSRTVYGGDQ